MGNRAAAHAVKSPRHMAFSCVTYYKECLSSIKVRMTSSTRSNTTGGSSTVPVTLFIPLAAPQHKSTSHAALVQWRKLRSEYEDEVAMRCNNDAKMMDVLVSVKKSFDKRLLTGWCDFEWDVDVATISDEFILKKIDKILSSVNNNSEPDEAALQIECRHGHESE
ncbi:hypothetical protein PR003_g24166 [Phytophthora rubi]|uniref:Uncharacterized protein n=1 Tax=Phytophthora rubi TaxID=129364 RepID=A0A6A4CVS4_9STRA|nr:hypothetical protein PR003_g24166 [Phytophthora rubi]